MNESYMSCCDWSKCTFCGNCLMKCPYLELEKEDAVSEIKKLIAGEPANLVFDNCAKCFNCNRYCPENLRPADLITQRIIENRNGKVPYFLTYLINSMPTGSLMQDMYARLTRDEKEILEKWEEIPPSGTDEILFIGCIGRISCYDIENSQVLKDLPKFSPADICCGELAYRMIGWECYSDLVERTLKRFEELNIKRMVCYCGSCYNFFSNILPNVYGKSLPFELVSLYEWMLQKIENGELEVKNPLNYTAAVSESCYVSELGPEFQEILRKLYRAAGADLVELKHHGDYNLSCGCACASARPNKLMRSLIKGQRKKHKELKEANIKEAIVNCPGCMIFLSLTNRLLGKKKWHYAMDDLLGAFGDEITKPLNKRTGFFIRTIMPKFLKLYKKVKYPMPRIPVVGPVPGNWKEKSKWTEKK
ncbi:MAG: 4Fe-4S dicluster domain-containing protein [Candidatus Helarchaeota archaeon]